MNDQDREKNSSAESKSNANQNNDGEQSSPRSLNAGKEPSAEKDEAVAADDLSPEEQMERFEEQLKEDDWGHQPC